MIHEEKRLGGEGRRRRMRMRPISSLLLLLKNLEEMSMEGLGGVRWGLSGEGGEAGGADGGTEAAGGADVGAGAAGWAPQVL